MRNFHKADPSRQYETYCPGCKSRAPLTWEDIKWLQLYQDIGQHPRYECRVCPTDTYGMRRRLQVRPVRRIREEVRDA